MRNNQSLSLDRIVSVELRTKPSKETKSDKSPDGYGGPLCLPSFPSSSSLISPIIQRIVTQIRGRITASALDLLITNHLTSHFLFAASSSEICAPGVSLTDFRVVILPPRFAIFCKERERLKFWSYRQVRWRINAAEWKYDGFKAQSQNTSRPNLSIGTSWQGDIKYHTDLRQNLAADVPMQLLKHVTTFDISRGPMSSPFRNIKPVMVSKFPMTRENHIGPASCLVLAMARLCSIYLQRRYLYFVPLLRSLWALRLGLCNCDLDCGLDGSPRLLSRAIMHSRICFQPSSNETKQLNFPIHHRYLIQKRGKHQGARNPECASVGDEEIGRQGRALSTHRDSSHSRVRMVCDVEKRREQTSTWAGYDVMDALPGFLASKRGI
ncbi:uncharacterized protein CLUP02_00115 [Colletotrichum lupini]|uniref:Uncharacterized protein n=1 Tax=Colletotrichum lupini TaxID=145971 RepID=A0A9Q8SA45_9PEZI|nr:uncharacterized protein CLUP02_00115 [Colletotrichum lupini]UQC73470.1 hypothetical protein CLUP02_00115 [Colletotrichum lupini]